MAGTFPMIWLIALSLGVLAALGTIAVALGRLAARSDHGARRAARADRTLGALHERLGRIDAAQARIEALSADVLGLQDILSNKQARGAFGEVQLRDIVGRALPPDAVSWQATLSNGRRPDCLVHMPDGPLVIDAKFPLEGYEALLANPDDPRPFRDGIRAHLRAIADRYLIAGETAGGALMFLPSEAIFAELHANHGAVVREGFDRGVYAVSPTTCMAVLNTLRAVLRDHRMREAAGELRRQLGLLHRDVGLVEARSAKLSAHLDMARRDLDGLGVAAARVAGRAARIETLDFGDAPGAAPDGARDAPQRPMVIRRGA